MFFKMSVIYGCLNVLNQASTVLWLMAYLQDIFIYAILRDAGAH